MAVLAAERLTAVLEFNAERLGPTAGLKASPCSAFSLPALLWRTAARDSCHDGAICALCSPVISSLTPAHAGMSAALLCALQADVSSAEACAAAEEHLGRAGQTLSPLYVCRRLLARC